MANSTFSKLSDDVVLKILSLLEDDPRNWARLSCSCKKFSSLISTVCCKAKCISTFPSIAADLSSPTSSPPGGWSSLYKIAVCCPGIIHSGLLLDNSDFGLRRELGPDEDYHHNSTSSSNNYLDPRVYEHEGQDSVRVGNSISTTTPEESQTWTMYDDLYFDMVYDNSESTSTSISEIAVTTATTTTTAIPMEVIPVNESESKKRKIGSRQLRSHLASGVWNLSREQGNKLLASRFRDDCLFISDWPGCIHMEEKRNYMLFRGIFKNFKRSRVWRTINDGNYRSRIDVNCAFCNCMETWDLHSAFCLKRGFGFHDDGEPVVRAYVCENGHVAGAWTDLPLYA